MQRWIVLGVVAIALLAGGAWFSYPIFKQSRPHPVWVPLPINPELPVAKRDKVIDDLKTKLGERARLIQVSRDVGLVGKWHLASDEEGARIIGERLFVKAGDADTPMGKVPAIHIGVTGNNKESGVSSEIVMRLMNDVWTILGIEPPAKKAP